MAITRSGDRRGVLLTSMLVLAGVVTEARAATYVVDSTRARFDDSWHQLERLHERLAAAANPAPEPEQPI